MILVSMDYKDLEGIVAAVIAEQGDYIQEYKAGVDHHQALADKLGITRPQAKILNHSVRYGRSPYTIGLELKVSQEEASALIRKYWSVNNKVAQFRRNLIAYARKNKSFTTYFKLKKIDVVPAMKDDQIFATYIQGSGADLVKIAMLKCALYLKEHKAGRIMLNMHDQLVFALEDESHIEPLKELMENANEHFPLKVDVKVGEF